MVVRGGEVKEEKREKRQRDGEVDGRALAADAVDVILCSIHRCHGSLLLEHPIRVKLSLVNPPTAGGGERS